MVAFGAAFRFWLKLGFISFGGPAGQIAIMHRELVERRRWIDEKRFLHALNFCMLLPGPEAQQLATYIGWLFHGIRGGIVAGALFVLPSVFVLLALSLVYARWGAVPGIAAALAGIKPVVVALVLEALVRIGRRALTRAVDLIVAAASFLAIALLHVPFPAIVLAAGIVGLLAGASRVDEAVGEAPPAVGRSLTVLAAGAALWVLPFLVLGLARGWGSLHVEEYRFFTQAALVTFGGAYAALAYATQHATGPAGWITPAQAIDGLALAESTPGPLIMVLQFVGFLAAWNRPEGMSPGASGVLGALVTTWVTFLPSFVFVLAGAPYVEGLRGNRRLAAALSGVTAAVVGVILNLAVVFASAVFRPGAGGSWPWASVAICGAALVALWRFKVDAVWLVLVGAVAGWALL